MSEEPKVKKSLGEKLQSVNRSVLYLILLIAVTVPLILTKFLHIQLPSKPEQYTKDAYILLRNLGPNDTIIIDSGFTNSSRGENGGQLEALLRMCMREKVKFVLFSSVDPQSTQIARDFIRKLNNERRAKGEDVYRRWDDYVEMGFFSDAPTMLQTMGEDLKRAWANRKVKDREGVSRDVFSSPPMKHIKKIEDFKAYVTIAASGIMPTIVPRVGSKVPVISMITGVMFPEQYNYYKSGQLKGLVNGLSGCVELETLMDKGIDAHGEVGGKALPMQAEPFKGYENFHRGMAYYLALHVALAVLIIAVVIGNIGMFMTKRSSR